MSNKKRIEIDLGFATLTVGILAFIGVIIGIFKEDIFTCIGSHNLSSSSDDFESDNTSDASDLSSSDSGSNLEGKNNLLYNEKGRVELFNDHSGIAYIYKKYLDDNPIGLIDEYSNFKIIGWSIVLNYQNKSFSFNIDSRQNDDKDHPYCSAQYNINEEPQNIFLNKPNVSYETNGDLKIEFNFDNVPFDLRDSSTDIIIRDIVIGIKQ